MLPRQWWAEGAVSSTARFPSAALGQGDPLDISARPPSSGIFSVTRPVCNARRWLRRSLPQVPSGRFLVEVGEAPSPIDASQLERPGREQCPGREQGAKEFARQADSLRCWGGSSRAAVLAAPRRLTQTSASDARTASS
jgi:hypothetical protein